MKAMPDSPHNWIGLEFSEDLDSEAFRRKKRREAKFELWGRGIFAVVFLVLAIVGFWQKRAGTEFFVLFMTPVMASLAITLFFLRRSQLTKEQLAERYLRKTALQEIKLTITTEGDDGTVVGEPLDYYWAYANSFEVVEAGIEVTFKHGRKTKTILVPSAMFPDPGIMEDFRAYAKGEAARRGLQPKEHWFRPPG